MLKEGNFIAEESSSIYKVNWKYEKSEGEKSIGLLTVEFKSGGKYSYDNVPAQIYQNFCNADSKGKYFHREISNTYNYKKLN